MYGKEYYQEIPQNVQRYTLFGGIANDITHSLPDFYNCGHSPDTLQFIHTLFKIVLEPLIGHMFIQLKNMLHMCFNAIG